MKSIVKIILRIFALYFGFKALLLINNFIYYLGSVIEVINNYGGPDYRYYIFSFILHTTIGIALWNFNEQIAGIIIRNEDTTNYLQINITYNQLMNITMKIFGIILFLNSIEPIVSEIINMNEIHLNLLYSDYRSYYIMALLNPVIKLIIGLVLIFKKENGMST